MSRGAGRAAAWLRARNAKNSIAPGVAAPSTCRPASPRSYAGQSSAMLSRRRRWQNRPLTGESTKETVKPLRGESRDCSAEPVVLPRVQLCRRLWAPGVLLSQNSADRRWQQIYNRQVQNEHSNSKTDFAANESSQCCADIRAQQRTEYGKPHLPAAIHSEIGGPPNTPLFFRR